MKNKEHLIESPADMMEQWELYKTFCDGYQINVTEFSQRSSQFVTEKLNKPISFTLAGFSLFCGLSKKGFIDKFVNDIDYTDVLSRIYDEIEQDCRRKFETSQIEPRLSGLWMSQFGYSMPKQGGNTAEAAMQKLDTVLEKIVGNI